MCPSSKTPLAEYCKNVECWLTACNPPMYWSTCQCSYNVFFLVVYLVCLVCPVCIFVDPGGNARKDSHEYHMDETISQPGDTHEAWGSVTEPAEVASTQGDGEVRGTLEPSRGTCRSRGSGGVESGGRGEKQDQSRKQDQLVSEWCVGLSYSRWDVASLSLTTWQGEK